ncbi:Aliphatic amidase AmiE [hydrothermal vent metagenome]|uniref:Aliphatic amidase AmiE n=1 Tax=hydrothermal vent metagenome TaxID=652676 RepID=A0A3B0V2P9_9ZZZZ
MANIKAGFLQTAPVFGDLEGNVGRVVKRLGRADTEGLELVVLPELFSTGYQFTSKKELRSLAEDLKDGYSVRRLGLLAKDRGMHIVAGIAERSGRDLYNSSVLIGPKGLISVYRKAHLFWNEKSIFCPGDTPPEVVSIGKARLGMMICFDWLFPEVARALALKGADIICHPSNLVLPNCPQAMITRCLENRVFAITANRVGTEDRGGGEALTFIGKSQIVTPDGALLERASGKRAAFAMADIDIAVARDKRITPKNHIFRDRRQDFF